MLTAAHCFRSRAGVLDVVRIGEFNTTSEEDCQKGICAPPHQDFKPEEIIIHPKYESRENTNDIALIRLNGTIDIPSTL